MNIYIVHMLVNFVLLLTNAQLTKSPKENSGGSRHWLVGSATPEPVVRHHIVVGVCGKTKLLTSQWPSEGVGPTARFETTPQWPEGLPDAHTSYSSCQHPVVPWWRPSPHHRASVGLLTSKRQQFKTPSINDFSLHGSMCVVCMYVSMCVCMRVGTHRCGCECMWRPEADIGSLSRLLPTLLIEAGSLIKPRVHW